MTFTLLSPLVILLGLAGLGLALWLLQRLRVQHREVEVISTLFWQAAIDQRRVRVFKRKFRHWPAWALLFAIASLMWVLFASPITRSLSGTQHVVLLDQSTDDVSDRQSDLDLAIERAATLPTASREIIAVHDHLQTVLAAGEPAETAWLRASVDAGPASNGVSAAIQTVADRAAEGASLSIHLVGDAKIESDLLQSLPSNVSVFRVQREAPAQELPKLTTFGLNNASGGQWDQVDVAIAFADGDMVDAAAIDVTLNSKPLSARVQPSGPGSFRVEGVPTNGGELAVRVGGEEVGVLTIPERSTILVQFVGDVPETLAELVAMDPACEIVDANGDLLIGSSENADLRLTTSSESAFRVQSEQEDVDSVLNELISKLALKQIDATSIAQQTGKVIDIQVVSGDERRVAVWADLFTDELDFRESRACPIFVARSIRWLANRPKIVPWAQRGETLPLVAPVLDRATTSVAATSDGRELRTTRLHTPIVSAASIDASPGASLLGRLSVTTWIGLLLLGGLFVEWTLYQRGRMP